MDILKAIKDKLNENGQLEKILKDIAEAEKHHKYDLELDLLDEFDEVFNDLSDSGKLKEKQREYYQHITEGYHLIRLKTLLIKIRGLDHKDLDKMASEVTEYKRELTHLYSSDWITTETRDEYKEKIAEYETLLSNHNIQTVDEDKLRQKRKVKLAVISLAVLLALTTGLLIVNAKSKDNNADQNDDAYTTSFSDEEDEDSHIDVAETNAGNISAEEQKYSTEESGAIDVSTIPAYSSDAYCEINGNVPFFSEYDKTRTDVFEVYSDQDYLGRCGVAYANICTDLMPDQERGSIGSVKPSGWHTIRYDDLIEDKYLYNRCHLIAYELAGENANEKNLITGTRYMNVTGMLPLENEVAEYVKSTGNHVLYRSTPVFEGENLVASGVEIEAYSVEDNGDGICFNVYCYNVQPGITIDYTTGDSWRTEGDAQNELAAETQTAVKQTQEDIKSSETQSASQQTTETKTTETASTQTKSSGSSSTNTNSSFYVTESESAANSADINNCRYVVNTNKNKFHYPSCSSVRQMKKENAWYSNDSRESLISKGYDPCSRCNP